MDDTTKNKIIVAASVGGACAIFCAGLVLTILICRNRKLLRKRARERRMQQHIQQNFSPANQSCRTASSEPDWSSCMIDAREDLPNSDWQHRRKSTNHSWARNPSTNGIGENSSGGVSSWNCSRETSPLSSTIGRSAHLWSQSNTVSSSDWPRQNVNHMKFQNTNMPLDRESMTVNQLDNVNNMRTFQSNSRGGIKDNGGETVEKWQRSPNRTAENISHSKESSPYRDMLSPRPGLFIPCDTMDEDYQLDGIYMASMGRRGSRVEHNSIGKVSDSGISSSTGSSGAWWLRSAQTKAQGSVPCQQNVEQILQSVASYDSSNNNNINKGNKLNNNRYSNHDRSWDATFIQKPQPIENFRPSGKRISQSGQNPVPFSDGEWHAFNSDSLIPNKHMSTFSPQTTPLTQSQPSPRNTQQPRREFDLISSASVLQSNQTGAQSKSFVFDSTAQQPISPKLGENFGEFFPSYRSDSPIEEYSWEAKNVPIACRVEVDKKSEKPSLYDWKNKNSMTLVDLGSSAERKELLKPQLNGTVSRDSEEQRTRSKNVSHTIWQPRAIDN